jgi:lactoylglutathione lyase
MNGIRLNLLVLRVSNLDRAGGFYELLGMSFARHAHGNGPIHLSAEFDGFVFELYPATTTQPVTANTRIGFAVADVDEIATKLSSFAGAKLVTAPQDSEWGRRAVVADPDGHRIELTEFRKENAD